MKRYKRFATRIILILSALLLEGCTFSIDVFTTPTASAPMFPSVPSALTAVPPTVVPASATPTLISIGADTIPMLEIYRSFELEDSVRSLAFTPDSAILAAAGGNTEGFAIRIWDVAGGQALGILAGHSAIVWGIAFSPDGRLLASVSQDQTAKVWNWRAGDILTILEFPGTVIRVSFSPDGHTLAVGGADEPQNQIQNAAIWTYSVGSWEPQVKFPEYMDITALVYSPKGGILIGGGASRNVQVWDANAGTRLFTLNHAHQVLQAAISPDGSTVATATCETVVYPECADGAVWLWDLPSGKLLGKLTGFPDFVQAVAFTTDGSSLIAGSWDGTLRFYRTADYQTFFEITSRDGIGALAVSPDGGLLATGGNHGKVDLWRIVYRP